ncbi:helix-turn-helix transcriptional regulator [Desulfotruncus arcticus]|uniref:helix-turn-helix transcriptional regulator n=1 Tax=Desulfotruncus arcticus TaxID=341036 RepID=UPI0013F4E026|nr:helix-turn-helix transcriptional regulator [Desulfotruncus arcticus]
MEVDEVFGAQLRYFRKKQKLSQLELGRLVNKPQTTISDWETGKLLPDINEAVKLAATLGVKLTDLLEEQAS